MSREYLTDKEKITIYAVQHPDTPIGTLSEQRKALMKTYGKSNTNDAWNTKSRMIRAILIIGAIVVLGLLAILEPHFLLLPLLL